MRYIIANKAKSVDMGINTQGHKTKRTQILLNEKEVTTCNALLAYPTLEDKCKQINGKIYSHVQVIQEIEKGGWKYE